MNLRCRRSSSLFHAITRKFLIGLVSRSSVWDWDNILVGGQVINLMFILDTAVCLGSDDGHAFPITQATRNCTNEREMPKINRR